MKKLVFLFLLFFPLVMYGQQKYTISGNLKDTQNGEDLVGATISVQGSTAGTTTNTYGFYSLTLPAGPYTLVYSYLGYTAIAQSIYLNQNINLNLELTPSAATLQEVVITSHKKDANVQQNKMSTDVLPMETIKTLPAFMGEVDVMKTIQMLPGVQSGGEGTSGFYVRGGSIDQNLIQLDEAPVYNASHLMGFFSVFNADAIKEVELYKGGIPAEYGGRLSSLVDIRMKEGNNKHFDAYGGIGTIASRFTLEGPIVKDKSSFILSGRRTYADMFLKLSSDENINKNKLYFYDLNTKLNYKIGKKDRLFISGYFGRDVFQYKELMRMDWGNATATARWNHLFTDKLFSNFTAIYSNFNYNIGMPSGNTAFSWKSNIEDVNLKADFSYFPNNRNTIKFGLSSIYHTFKPGIIQPRSETSVVRELLLDEKYALENAFYLSNEQEISPHFSFTYGLRYSFFQNMGGRVQNYDATHQLVTDTVTYARTHIYKTQGGFEPRLSARLLLNENSSLKASYNRTLQYLHLASNATSASPFDVYIPSGKYIKPQSANQIALGYFRNFRQNTLEASAEVYYKDLKNQIDFRDNAELLLNNNLETEILTGTGKAYGLELMVKKQTGRLTGWASYTLSHTERTIKGINSDKAYPVRQDKPHNLAVVMSYQISDRLTLGANQMYSSGNVVTMPSGSYRNGNIIVPIYTERNGYRLRDYHRLDLSLTLNNKKQPGQKYESSWNFSVFNAYGRKNVFSVQLDQTEETPSRMESKEISIIGAAIQAVTYNFKF
ncbi:TonB-dependent receptor [Adhaeribacter radiodurans]|uniref:TonB-dependent receptor n=1 Tax=Adhaeribacter radiodurans TaxID=2745197 RepID=A0A7L7L7F8_9BACT|nr:TonB-dependent receptor [Adhaeribacter radiodurans]QMU28740.1 TonB-dependent receptor [Adhaeribacter radiodurans]